MNGKKIIVIPLLCAMLLNGCASMLTVGENQTYCVENGADHTDAGICADPMEIYKNRHSLYGTSSSCQREN